MYKIDKNGRLIIDYHLPVPPITNEKDLILYTVYLAPPGGRAPYYMKQFYILPGKIVWYGWERWFNDIHKAVSMMYGYGFSILQANNTDKPEVILSFI